jgi:hypothetical protein
MPRTKRSRRHEDDNDRATKLPDAHAWPPLDPSGGVGWAVDSQPQPLEIILLQGAKAVWLTTFPAVAAIWRVNGLPELNT